MLATLTIIVVLSFRPAAEPKVSTAFLTSHSTLQSPEILQKNLEKLLAENNFPAAKQTLGELQQHWPNDSRLFQAEGAVLMLEKSDFQRALLAFQKARALSPDDAELVLNVAEAEFALGHYAEAESNYRLFRTATPDSELVPFRLYLCAIKQKKDDEAEAILNNASVIYQSPSWCYIRAVKAAQNGNPRQARELVQLARLLHGKKTRIFDETLEALGLNTIARLDNPQ